MTAKMRDQTEQSFTLAALSLAIAVLITAAAAGGPIHPTTYELGRREQGYIHAWVFFSHKPGALLKGIEVTPVTAKAQDRRNRRGLLGSEQIRQLDQAVSPDFLQQVRDTGAEIRRESRWLNAVSVRASPEQLETLAQLSFVTAIEPVRRMANPPPPDATPPSETKAITKGLAHQLDYGPSYDQLALINVPEVHDRGYTGKGITVLMLDTGFFKGHESILEERIIDEYDFLDDDTETQNETTEENRAGQHNHGTNTYTSLGGYSPGKLIGPAFQCSYLLAKTESKPLEVQAEEDNYVAGLEWGEVRGADIVSSSLGYLDWYAYEDLDGQTAVTTRAVLWATRLGMLVVTAAGNEGDNSDWGGYIIAPGDADSIITVGSVNSLGDLAYTSGRGPTYDGRVKPEVVAQGVDVYCATSGGPTGYAYVDGTSMATPLVTGSAALILEAHPTWGPQEVREALMATASRADQPNNDYGWGIPNVLAAINYDGGVLADQYTSQIDKVYPNPFSSEKNNHITIEWSMENRSAVRLDIYDLLGRHIVNLYSRPSKAAGPYLISWNGNSARGQRVAAGIYLIRLTVGLDVTSKRVAIQH